jgi:pimeloyl-ACP methyl ester carboxylesterase
VAGGTIQIINPCAHVECHRWLGGGSVGMRDRIVNLGEKNKLVGILSQAEGNPPGIARPAVIILNAGLIHRVGPNRTFVDLSRQLSQQGFNVLRFDFSGIGDSDPREDHLPFEKSAPQEVCLAMDHLAQEGMAAEFVLIGLCSGAAIAFQVASLDQRVIGAVIINAPAPNTPAGEKMRASSFYWRKALFNQKSWSRIILGKSSYREVWSAIVTQVQLMFFFKAAVQSEPEEIGASLKAAFQTFRGRATRLLFISSGDEVGVDYIRRIAGCEHESMRKSGLLSIEILSATDHLFTPIEAQKRLSDRINQWMTSFQ